MPNEMIRFLTKPFSHHTLREVRPVDDPPDLTLQGHATGQSREQSSEKESLEITSTSDDDQEISTINLNHVLEQNMTPSRSGRHARSTSSYRAYGSRPPHRSPHRPGAKLRDSNSHSKKVPLKGYCHPESHVDHEAAPDKTEPGITTRDGTRDIITRDGTRDNLTRESSEAGPASPPIRLFDMKLPDIEREQVAAAHKRASSRRYLRNYQSLVRTVGIGQQSPKCSSAFQDPSVFVGIPRIEGARIHPRTRDTQPSPTKDRVFTPVQKTEDPQQTSEDTKTEDDDSERPTSPTQPVSPVNIVLHESAKANHPNQSPPSLCSRRENGSSCPKESTDVKSPLKGVSAEDSVVCHTPTPPSRKFDQGPIKSKSSSFRIKKEQSLFRQDSEDMSRSNEWLGRKLSAESLNSCGDIDMDISNESLQSIGMVKSRSGSFRIKNTERNLENASPMSIRASPPVMMRNSSPPTLLRPIIETSVSGSNYNKSSFSPGRITVSPLPSRFSPLSQREFRSLGKPTPSCETSSDDKDWRCKHGRSRDSLSKSRDSLSVSRDSLECVGMSTSPPNRYEYKCFATMKTAEVAKPVAQRTKPNDPDSRSHDEERLQKSKKEITSKTISLGLLQRIKEFSRQSPNAALQSKPPNSALQSKTDIRETETIEKSSWHGANDLKRKHSVLPVDEEVRSILGGGASQIKPSGMVKAYMITSNPSKLGPNHRTLDISVVQPNKRVCCTESPPSDRRPSINVEKMAQAVLVRRAVARKAGIPSRVWSTSSEESMIRPIPIRPNTPGDLDSGVVSNKQLQT